jgi:predicted amidohydrolase
VRVAAWQAPYLPFGSMDAVGLLRVQLDRCEAEGVELLCCPEAVIGGLAHESAGQSPADVALGVDELAEVVAPLLETPVTVVVGFTERDPSGALFGSAAVLRSGAIAAVYRKVYPGYRTVVAAGSGLPVFDGPGSFGIVICNDLWYVEPARVLAAAGAAVLLVPTHSGHLREPSESFRARGDNLPIARAVENSLTCVVADVADGRATGSRTASPRSSTPMAGWWPRRRLAARSWWSRTSSRTAATWPILEAGMVTPTQPSPRPSSGSGKRPTPRRYDVTPSW